VGEREAEGEACDQDTTMGHARWESRAPPLAQGRRARELETLHVSHPVAAPGLCLRPRRDMGRLRAWRGATLEAR
jgi:hypothetical protein